MGYDWYDSDEFYRGLEARMESSEKCTTCGGDGFVRKYNSATGVTDYADERCSSCNGRGKEERYVPDRDDDWYGY